MLDQEPRTSQALQRVLRVEASCTNSQGFPLQSTRGHTYSSFLLRLPQSTAVWTLGEIQDEAYHDCAARTGDLVSNTAHAWVCITFPPLVAVWL